MLIKAGVDISRLNREIRRALAKVDKLLKEFDQEIIITSTYEGNHGAGSLHYSNDAFDIRSLERRNAEIAALIPINLGLDYDVVRKSDHIHIEWDPK